MAQEHMPTGICIRKDIPYLKGQEREHLLDLYFPENTEGRLPVLVNIHGGGLFSGQKESNRSFNMRLAGYGYTVVSLNYPLLPDVSFRRQLFDVAEALRFIQRQQNDEAFHCDVEQLNVIGDGAGALLALYLAALQENGEMRKAFGISHFDIKIRSLGLISGMFYPNRLLQKVLCRYGKLQKKPYWRFLDVENLVRECSFAPMYLVTSEEDEQREDTLRLEALLKQQNHPYHLKVWKKVPGKELTHIFAVRCPQWEESLETVEEMLNYMKQQEI